MLVLSLSIQDPGLYMQHEYFPLTAPGQPTDLIGNTQNETSVLLQWSKPNDPNGIILGYQVLYYSYKANHTMVSIGILVIVIRYQYIQMS